MRPYSCYSPARTRFQPGTRRFTNSGMPQIRKTRSGNHVINTRPAANILRKENGFDIQMAIPGLAKDHVKIEIHENQLVVSATPGDTEVTPKMIRKEFNYNGFKRSFRLHKNANTEAIQATFDQGMLTISIPDTEKTTTKINIQ